MAMIEIGNLTKQYEEYTALDGLSLSIAGGESYGLLGPLGSGKSTLIKILATLVESTSGTATVGGHDVQAEPDAVRRLIGYMPDLLGVYGDLRVTELLEFYGMSCGLTGTRLAERTDRAIALAALESDRLKFIDALNSEERQRLALAKAILPDPPVLLLDRPAGGLSLAARMRLREPIGRLRAEGKTILMATNIIADTIGVCDRVGLLFRGKLLAEGPTGELTNRLADARVIEIELQGDLERAVRIVIAHPLTRDAQTHGDRLIFTLENSSGDPGEVVRALAASGIEVLGYREHEVDLELYLQQMLAGRAQNGAESQIP